ncbi:MAG: hypothetical protein KJ698_05800 [Actinobacteria bacterium]|nr:hypothetical protein [Actinomycetota bacterium]MBU1494608.1 hypothetical protein [Actinomycetota bacterium]MBU1866775.1 hypothetical protein [Actinomycetota bacterium]
MTEPPNQSEDVMTIAKPQNWRLTTWSIVGFNVAMLWFLLDGLKSAGAACADAAPATCEAVATMSAVMTIGMAVFFLVAGNLILGVVAITTRGRAGRTCPRCWAHVSTRMALCPQCGCEVAAKRRRGTQTA